MILYLSLAANQAFFVLFAGFFWLAAQGGYGIQSAAAAALLAACLLRGTALPPPLTEHGVTAERFAPSRLR